MPRNAALTALLGASDLMQGFIEIACDRTCDMNRTQKASLRRATEAVQSNDLETIAAKAVILELTKETPPVPHNLRNHIRVWLEDDAKEYLISREKLQEAAQKSSVRKVLQFIRDKSESASDNSNNEALGLVEDQDLESIVREINDWLE